MSDFDGAWVETSDFEREQRVADLLSCVFRDWLGDSCGARRLVEIIGGAKKRELDGVAGFREVAEAKTVSTQPLMCPIRRLRRLWRGVSRWCLLGRCWMRFLM